VNDNRIGFHPQGNYYVLQPKGLRPDIGEQGYFLGELRLTFNRKRRIEDSKSKSSLFAFMIYILRTMSYLRITVSVQAISFPEILTLYTPAAIPDGNYLFSTTVG